MAEEKDDAPPKKKGKLLLIIIAAVLILALGGGAAYYFLVMQPAAAAKAAEEADEEDDGDAKAKSKHKDDADATPAEGEGDGEKAAEPKKKKKKKKKKSDKEEPPAFLNLDPFTVNLADTEQERFLQISIVIQVAGEPATEEYKKHMAMVRDTILKLLSSSKSADLRSAEGKQKLADQIISNIEKAADRDGIEMPEIDKVFFTAFIIQ